MDYTDEEEEDLLLTPTEEAPHEYYHVKGYWTIEGIFNGSIYCNNRKFGNCVRVRSDIISVTASLGKTEQYRKFKKYLIKNKLTRHAFITNRIQEFCNNNPNKKIRVV